MFMDVYIGNLTDEYNHFNWDGWSDVGNAPIRRSPFFPAGREANSELQRRIKAGIYEGRQVDWGAWVAKVKKQQIIEFIADTHPEKIKEGWWASPHLQRDYDELIDFVEALDPDTCYALTASEL